MRCVSRTKIALSTSLRLSPCVSIAVLTVWYDVIGSLILCIVTNQPKTRQRGRDRTSYLSHTCAEEILNRVALGPVRGQENDSDPIELRDPDNLVRESVVNLRRAGA